MIPIQARSPANLTTEVEGTQINIEEENDQTVIHLTNRKNSINLEETQSITNALSILMGTTLALSYAKQELSKATWTTFFSPPSKRYNKSSPKLTALHDSGPEAWKQFIKKYTKWWRKNKEKEVIQYHWQRILSASHAQDPELLLLTTLVAVEGIIREHTLEGHITIWHKKGIENALRAMANKGWFPIQAADLWSENRNPRAHGNNILLQNSEAPKNILEKIALYTHVLNTLILQETKFQGIMSDSSRKEAPKTRFEPRNEEEMIEEYQRIRQEQPRKQAKQAQSEAAGKRPASPAKEDLIPSSGIEKGFRQRQAQANRNRPNTTQGPTRGEGR